MICILTSVEPVRYRSPMLVYSNSLFNAFLSTACPGYLWILFKKRRTFKDIPGWYELHNILHFEETTFDRKV